MTLEEWFARDDAPTKVAFAAAVGRSPSMITDMCKGRVRPSLHLALLIEERTDGLVRPSEWIGS